MTQDGRTSIYIVEDDAVIGELLEYNLHNEGYFVLRFPDGPTFFRQVGELAVPDLLILDLMLPGMDGFEICRRLRERSTFERIPVLILTARGSESDKVRGLEAGADDYLTKPFGMRELMARVRALLRRYQKTTASERQADDQKAASGADDSHAAVNGVIADHGIILDDARHRVFLRDREIEMTHREYELLKYLMAHRGIALSRDDLLCRVWGYDYAGETRTVDVHIRQLRRKLEEDSAEPLIETIRGRGYRWTDRS